MIMYKTTLKGIVGSFYHNYTLLCIEIVILIVQKIKTSKLIKLVTSVWIAYLTSFLLIIHDTFQW
jgi:hypothetical protein